MTVDRNDKYIYNGREKSFRMFNRIHKRYDLLNRIFSFGQDIVWRRRLSRHIASRENQRLLDLATGTGDVAFSLLKHAPQIQRAGGCDMALNMLGLAKRKSIAKKMHERIAFFQGDAANIPVPDGYFDVTTIAFGIRNMADPVHVLTEMHRILNNKGQALILEFSLPENRFFRHLHLFYLRRFIPSVGAFISKDKQAYRYLNETIESFPYGKSFCRLMESAGFRNIRFYPLTFGVATLYRGEK
jgi:demethylmenaquinone methyltransferase / 2-methoxy-6-polyprenyl-1,4-benzoquinol methylase